MIFSFISILIFLTFGQNKLKLFYRYSTHGVENPKYFKQNFDVLWPADCVHNLNEVRCQKDSKYNKFLKCTVTYNRKNNKSYYDII